MVELIADNWLLFLIAFVVGLLVAWWIFVASRRTKVEIEQREDQASATPKRNQALIDSPPVAASTTPPPTPQGLAGSGAAVTAAVIGPATGPATAPPREHAAGTGEAPLPVASPPAPDSAPRAEAPPQARAEPDPFQSAEPPPPAAERGQGALAFPPLNPAAAPPGLRAAEPPSIAREQPAAALPAPEPARAPTSALAPAGGDELLRIKGLGPKLAQQLRTLGVDSLAQIAAWDDAQIELIDAQLGRFQGRIRRDDWPEQARLLTAGDTAAYESRFGKV